MEERRKPVSAQTALADGGATPGLWKTVLVFALAPILLYFIIWGSELLGSPGRAERLTDFTAFVDGAKIPHSVDVTGHGYRIDVKNADVIEFHTDISDYMARYDKPELLVSLARRVITVTLDGQEITPSGVRSDMRFYRPMQPHFFFLEGAASPEGKLILTVKSQDAIPFIRTVWIGNAPDLERAFMWRQVFGVYSIVVALAICLMSFLISLALGVSRSLRAVTWNFAGLMLCWIVVNMAYGGLMTLMPTNLYRVIYSLASFLMIVASLSFVNEWTFQNLKIRHGLVPLSTLALFILLVPIYFTDMEGWQLVLTFADIIAVACVIVMLVQLFHYLSRRKRPPLFEGFIFLICIWAVMTDVLVSASRAIGHVIWPQTGMSLLYGPTLSTLLGLTIVAGFVRLFTDSQRAMSGLNARLSSELIAREAEIADMYKHREESMREAALMDERKRIMRDMHDGVGGRLLALSLKAKNNRLGPDVLQTELDDSLQELRLIIDSMDTADGELDIALGALRGRIEPLIFDAGMELVWDIEELGPQPDFGPRDVLSIYRIIQESVSNAIRHAHAKTLTVTTRNTDGRIMIDICDDGRGFSSEIAAGKGLSNIRTRAGALGGHANITSGPSGGTCVRIDLPGKPIAP